MAVESSASYVKTMAVASMELRNKQEGAPVTMDSRVGVSVLRKSAQSLPLLLYLVMGLASNSFCQHISPRPRELTCT